MKPSWTPTSFLRWETLGTRLAEHTIASKAKKPASPVDVTSALAQISCRAAVNQNITTSNIRSFARIRWIYSILFLIFTKLCILLENKKKKFGEHHKTKGLRSKTMTVHLRHKSLDILLLSYAKHPEMTKFCVFWRTYAMTANFSYFPLKLIAYVTPLVSVRFRPLGALNSSRYSRVKYIKSIFFFSRGP